MSLSPASHLLTSNHVPINHSAQSNTDAEKSLKGAIFSLIFNFKSHPRQITQLNQTLKQKSQWKGATFHRHSTSDHTHVKSLSSIRHWSRKVSEKGPLFTDFLLQIPSTANYSVQSAWKQKIQINQKYFSRQANFHRDVECGRSEEHTSELQSPVPISYAVFCLKKKKNKKPRL